MIRMTETDVSYALFKALEINVRDTFTALRRLAEAQTQAQRDIQTLTGIVTDLSMRLARVEARLQQAGVPTMMES
jgi:hypothetical protein